MDLYIPAVVIDNGSGTIKAGFAGEQAPKCVFPNFVGTPKHVRLMPGDLPTGEFIGPKAEQHRGLLKLIHPMEHGIVGKGRWSDMEKVWNYVYSKEQLGVSPEEHPVLLTEAPLNPRKNRLDACKYLFDTMNVPAVYVSMQAVLSLFATGRTTGVVLDSGDGVTHAVPIYEGFALNHSIMRSDVAGREITKYLQLLLRKEGHVFRTSAEFQIVKQIKETHCYVAYDERKEETMEIDRNDDRNMYNLPDGRSVQIGAAKFRAPEALFDPMLIGDESVGIHEVLVNSVQKSDMDLRRTLWSNIVLSGGSTMVEGFCPRILREVKKLAPKDIRIRVSAPRDRIYTTWSGGSILAGLATFKNIWVTKQEWEEKGEDALRKFPDS